MLDVGRRYNLPMRLRSILASVLVAMVLSGAGFGPVCEALCTEATQILSCGGHGMQSPEAPARGMAGMRNCAVCGTRGPTATAPAGLCGHDSIAEIRTVDGHEGSAALQISQRELEVVPALPARLTMARFSLADPPASRITSPISMHTTLRV
jgi:hypothetical protein